MTHFPGNKLPGYYHLVPAGRPDTSLHTAVMTGPEADENDRSLHPSQKRDQMVLQERTGCFDRPIRPRLEPAPERQRP